MTGNAPAVRRQVAGYGGRNFSMHTRNDFIILNLIKQFFQREFPVFIQLLGVSEKNTPK